MGYFELPLSPVTSAHCHVCAIVHAYRLEHPFSLTMTSAGTLDTLPIIDIAPFLSSDPADANKRAATSAALHAACVEYGFFYLNIDAYVDRSEPEELTRLAKEFFSLPQEEKDKLALSNQDYARGACLRRRTLDYDNEIMLQDMPD